MVLNDNMWTPILLVNYKECQMKNKFLFLIFTLISFASSAYSDTTYPETYDETYAADYDYGIYDAYPYATLGVGPVIFIPNVGIGYRQRNCQFGWDTGLSFSSIGYAHQLTGHLVGHYYFSPYKLNSAYVGFGLMGSGVVTNHHGCGGSLSPDFVIGKAWNDDCSRHFIEMHVGVPSLMVDSKHQHALYLPLMYVKYGFSF